MAKKKDSTAKSGGLVQIKFETKPDTPFFYVNYMAVGQNATDFTISAVRAPGEVSADQMELIREGKPITLEPTLQLVVPPMVAKGLILALVDQVAKYEARFGKIAILTPEGKVKV